MKTPAKRINVDGDHFENGTFRKRHDSRVICPPESSSSNIHSLMCQAQGVFKRFCNDDRCTVRTQNILFVFSVEGKLLLRFQSENTVFKFIRRSLDGGGITLLA